MKKVFATSLIIIIAANSSYAQTASEVLEGGLPTKKNENIFIQYDPTSKKFNYNINKRPTSYIPLEDNAIFLPHEGGMNIYTHPLNPLNFDANLSVTISNDMISEATIAAFTSIFKGIKGLDNPAGEAAGLTGDCSFADIKTKLTTLTEDLDTKNKKKQIIYCFNTLQSLTFNDEIGTERGIKIAEDSIISIKKHIGNLEKEIKIIQECLNNYGTGDQIGFTTKFAFQSILDKAILVKDNQKQKYESIASIAKVVRDYKTIAETVRAGNIKWVVPLQPVPISVTRGKISTATVKVTTAGFKLDGTDSDKIIAVNKELLQERIFRLRRFDRFVTEVSAGTAYTFFDYVSYGIEKDPLGVNRVSQPIKKDIRNLKFTTMVNFNYFLLNSALHPFWQIGVGANSEVPTVLTGVGLRSNINGLSRLAISGGIALTFIQKLNQLQVGQIVTGTADVERDLQYNFTWPPKPYIGLQYNF